jgi:hypothetical protein
MNLRSTFGCGHRDGNGTVVMSPFPLTEERTMAHTPWVRRWGTAATIGGIAALSIAAPATARPDEGTPTPSQPSTTIVREVEVPVDDNALEYLQIGAAALTGMAVAGAALVGTRRLRSQPQLT